LLIYDILQFRPKLDPRLRGDEREKKIFA